MELTPMTDLDLQLTQSLLNCEAIAAQYEPIIRVKALAQMSASFHENGVWFSLIRQWINDEIGTREILVATDMQCKVISDEQF